MTSRSPVHFFTASLKHGHLMSRPKYPVLQLLVGETIQAIERAHPRAAWVQLLFVYRDHSRAIVSAKASINETKKAIETPKVDFLSGNEYARRELQGDWYRRADERVKKLDELTPQTTVVMCVQGMWIGKAEDVRELPFSRCSDESDSLQVFLLHDPRMMVDLVERRMVEDISPYFASYTGSRAEPPSFLITADELPYYIHLPVGKQTDVISSVKWGVYSPLPVGTAWSMEEQTTETPSQTSVLEATSIPRIDEELDETAVARLSTVGSYVRRGFELVFDGSQTRLLLSSKSPDDMRRYEMTFEGVYGPVEFRAVDPRPPFLAEVPALVGLQEPTQTRG